MQEESKTFLAQAFPYTIFINNRTKKDEIQSGVGDRSFRATSTTTRRISEITWGRSERWCYHVYELLRYFVFVMNSSNSLTEGYRKWSGPKCVIARVSGSDR
jgi:hypothetical protein